MSKLNVDKIPKYRCHPRHKQGVVRLNGRDHYLGRYGTPQSKERYQRLIAEWLAGKRQPIVRQEALAQYTVKELVLAYHKHAEGYYRKNGKATDEVRLIDDAIRVLRELYGSTPAAEFTPKKLKAVREAMVEKGWSRGHVNKQVSRVKRAFSWAVSEDLIPGAVTQALAEVDGLKKGRCEAPEGEGVTCVPDEVVDATLPHLPAIVADMVAVQRATGMRPCELVAIRPMDVDASGDIWIYHVGDPANKNDHHGQDRFVAIPLRAQQVLAPYLDRPADKFCFSPRESEERRRAAMRAARKTPLSCGNKPRASKPTIPQSVRDFYTTESYRNAIHSGCAKAFPVPEGLSEEGERRWVSDHEWNPNQLRHNVGTAVREQFGLDAAQSVLGHRKCDVTQVYAELSKQRAVNVMRQLG